MDGYANFITRKKSVFYSFRHRAHFKLEKKDTGYKTIYLKKKQVSIFESFETQKRFEIWNLDTRKNIVL